VADELRHISHVLDEWQQEVLREPDGRRLTPTRRVLHEDPVREAIFRLDVLTAALNNVRVCSAQRLDRKVTWMLAQVVADRDRLARELDARRAKDPEAR